MLRSLYIFSKGVGENGSIGALALLTNPPPYIRCKSEELNSPGSAYTARLIQYLARAVFGPGYVPFLVGAAVLLTSTGVVRAQEEQSSGPDWNNICNQVQSLLVQSCGDLVNSDGTLTQSGETAVGCIRNGVLLGLGGLPHLAKFPRAVYEYSRYLEYLLFGSSRYHNGLSINRHISMSWNL